jgi:hypothetical protein
VISCLGSGDVGGLCVCLYLLDRRVLLTTTPPRTEDRAKYLMVRFSSISSMAGVHLAAPMLETHEAAARFLEVHFAIVIAAAVGFSLATALIVRYHSRSSVVIPAVLVAALMLVIMVLSFLFTSILLAENCGAGGGCEDEPDWTYGHAFLVTGLPIAGILLATTAVLIASAVRRQHHV